MAKDSYIGRDYVVQFAIKPANNKPATADYKDLGMMRSKTIGVQWDTIDITADKSPDRTKEQMVSYKNVTFSGDGVSRFDAIYNQAELKNHVFNPSAATDNEPIVWLKLVSPTEIIEGPFTLTKWEISAPHDDAVTWSTEGASCGEIKFTLVTAKKG